MADGLSGIGRTIHAFDEDLEFHPSPRALATDVLFVPSGLLCVLPNLSLKRLEELFRARVITFLADKGLLPLEWPKMLRSWVHSRFDAHGSRRDSPDEREDPPSRFTSYGGTSLERLAWDIIRNPRAVEKLYVSAPTRTHPKRSII